MCLMNSNGQLVGAKPEEQSIKGIAVAIGPGK
jgi:hypothetical protein